MDNIDLLEHIQPVVGSPKYGPEPCLRTLVYAYYLQHMDVYAYYLQHTDYIRATELTDLYFEALKKELRK